MTDVYSLETSNLCSMCHVRERAGGAPNGAGRPEICRCRKISFENSSMSLLRIDWRLANSEARVPALFLSSRFERHEQPKPAQETKSQSLREMSELFYPFFYCIFANFYPEECSLPE